MGHHKRQKYIATLLMLAYALAAAAQEENMETIADSFHLEAYLVAALMIAVFTMIFSNRVFYYREKEVEKNGKQLNTQLALVLNSNKTQMWTFNTSRRIYTLFSEDGERKEYTPIDFAQTFFDLQDFSKFRSELLFDIRDGRKDEGTFVGKGKPDETNGNKQNIYEFHVSVLHRDKHGKPAVLLGIQRDITDERGRQESAHKMSMLYHTVFNSSMVDMIFYNEDGILTDINDKACETFGIKDREALLKRKVRMKDIPSYEHLDPMHLDNIMLSSITDIDRVKRERERIPEMSTRGLFYYEAFVNSIHNSEGKHSGVIAAGRDITEMVESHHRQQKDSQLLKEATKNVQSYIRDINYTLRTGGVTLLNYLPDSHELVVFSDLNKVQFRLEQIRCVSLIDVADRRKARGLLLRMDRRHGGNITETLRTRFHDDQGRNIYLTFSLVPVKGKDGVTTHYFGMFRNETEMAYTEANLLEETKKALETEELKSTFLTNMSYEIRTPLNAVLGFADLFNAPHDEADEPVFAEEIKRNTGDLLALINDILYISRLDAKMLEFKYEECDFAQLFESYCYMGWGMVSPGVNVSVENPYSHLMVTIDQEHLGEVIRKLCNGSACITTEGYIKARCDYRHGELTIIIEDTGKGHTRQELEHMFDRFVKEEGNIQNGTGLEMPIIKEIVTQMGGTIELQSEESGGNTVYVIIPCEMSHMEKKSENI